MASWSLMIQVKFLGVIPRAHFPLAAIALMLPSVRGVLPDASRGRVSCRGVRDRDRAGDDLAGLDGRADIVRPHHGRPAGQGPGRGGQRALEPIVGRWRIGAAVRETEELPEKSL